jgi:hypothetical protein
MISNAFLINPSALRYKEKRLCESWKEIGKRGIGYEMCDFIVEVTVAFVTLVLVCYLFRVYTPREIFVICFLYKRVMRVWFRERVHSFHLLILRDVFLSKLQLLQREVLPLYIAPTRQNSQRSQNEKSQNSREVSSWSTKWPDNCTNQLNEGRWHCRGQNELLCFSNTNEHYNTIKNVTTNVRKIKNQKKRKEEKEINLLRASSASLILCLS